MNRDRHYYELHAELCKLIANPKRQQILNALRHGERTVGEIAAQVGAREANISQHLARLRARGVVRTRREGTTIYYRLVYPQILQALDLMAEVLEEISKREYELSRLPEERAEKKL
ncbi:MAG: hypothetical protein KatS3mg115_1175 [Candidatus Poribacteria bacterium]|nr:MAG: hypothetical protein KatS3mg115_1175 [Candidatus Poribacteria bacterium]